MYQRMSLEDVNESFKKLDLSKDTARTWALGNNLDCGGSVYERSKSYNCKQYLINAESQISDFFGIKVQGTTYLDNFPGFINVDTKTKRVLVYRNHRDLQENRTTSMKPGRYLKAIGWPDKDVREMSNIFTTTCELHNNCTLQIARTPDDCEYVYVNGPNSCMSSDDSGFQTGGIHPARVYGNEYCGVAYVEIGSRIVARAVVSFGHEGTNKAHADIYGNSKLITALLDKEGYCSGDNFEDVQLNKVESSTGAIVCPYLDTSPNCVDVGDDHLLITARGYYTADQTTGLLDATQLCEVCDEYEQDTVYVESVDCVVCENCLDTSFIYYDDEYYRTDSDYVVHVDGDYYHVDDDDVRQDYNGDWYMSDELSYSDYYSEYVVTDDCTNALVGEGTYSMVYTSDTETVNGEVCYCDYVNEYRELMEIENAA